MYAFTIFLVPSTGCVQLISLYFQFITSAVQTEEAAVSLNDNVLPLAGKNLACTHRHFSF
jgi:hypothetical protein